MSASFLRRFLGNSAGLGGALIQRLGIAISDDYSDEASHPTISAGSGAPSASEPNGSLYLRTSGLIYRRVGSAWEQIIGAAGALVGDTVSELTSGAGVTVDGLLLKDGKADLNGVAGALILDADADTFLGASTDDQIDVTVSGAIDFTITANTLTAVSGSSIATNTIAETTADSGVTVDGLLVKDGKADLNGVAGALILDADADTHIGASTDDQIDVTIGGAVDFVLTANTLTASSGSSIATDTIAETTGAAGVTVDGCLVKDGRVAALATAGMFASSEQTGDGSEQSIAHGFGAAPSLVWVTLSELPADLAAGADVALGSHDATNILVTVTNGIKYRAYALK